MVSILKKSGFWGCTILAVVGLLHFAGCAQVENVTSQVTEKVAFEAGNTAMAKDDHAEAAAQYRKAAEAGNAEAAYYLGLLAAGGGDIPKNETEALKWMRMSAEKGYAPAQQHLGMWYLNGVFAPRDPAGAALWLDKAADQGNESAMIFLGAMYATGRGVSKNYDTALGWYQLAAAKGFPVPPEQLTLEGVAALDREYQAGKSAPVQTTQPAPLIRAATVQNVQAGLTELGYDPGPVDGMMGKKSANAIRDFQQDNNLPVDGKVSEDLMRRIDEKLAK